jgi:hypothetical protein
MYATSSGLNLNPGTLLSVPRIYKIWREPICTHTFDSIEYGPNTSRQWQGGRAMEGKLYFRKSVLLDHNTSNINHNTICDE